MKVFVLTNPNPELGWNCVMDVFEAENKEQIKKYLETEGICTEDLIIQKHWIINLKNEY